MLKLNLGCGKSHPQGYVNIDKSPAVNPDVEVDLEKGHLPYEDNAVDEIIAIHFLEHVHNIIPLMNECYRVLKPSGKMLIVVPQNEGTWCDPTHVRAFNKLSWRYYCGYPLAETYGITCRFRKLSQDFANNCDGGALSVVLQKP